MRNSIRYVWKQIPLFRAIWPFIGGLIVGVFVPDRALVFPIIATASLLIGVVLIAWSYGYSSFTNLSVIAIFGLGYVVTVIHTDRVFDGHVTEVSNVQGEVVFVARIISDPISRARSVKTEAEVSGIIHQGDTAAIHGKLLVYFQPSGEAEQLKFDDQVVFHARLNEIPAPQNPSEFNYRRYMHFHQVSNQVYLDSASWTLVNRGSGFRRMVLDWQHSIIERLESFDITDRELAIISALLVGYKHYLSSDQVNAFASAGAMHVLAVSGLHVGIIYLIIHTLLQFLDRSRSGRILKGILMILLLWLYALLTGLSPSVTRAATMFTFVIVARQFNRHTDIYNTLASSAFALLIYDPFLIVEVGFQLSYLAVLGIVLLQPRIYDLWKPKLWVVDKMWAITAVSLAAQAATFPLALLYFHQFPNYFLLSNLVVIPAATVILPLGVALIALAWVPYLSDALAWVLYQLVHFLDLFIQWVEHLPFALILGIDITIFETYLIYTIVAASCAFLMTKRYQWLVVSIGAMVLVECVNALEAYQQKQQRAVVFYKVKGFDAIDFISGTEHFFLADSTLKQNFDKMRFHVHHHWWERDLAPSKNELAGLYKSGSWILFQKLHILQMDSNAFVGSVDKPVVDLLYIKQRTLQKPQEILERLEVLQVILSTNLDTKSHRTWKKLCDERHIRVHSLREEGAFTKLLTD